jgi:hypothetical protein
VRLGSGGPGGEASAPSLTAGSRDGGATARARRRLQPIAVTVPVNSPPVVALRGVAVVRDGRPILDDVDWAVRPGERWAVLGPNGSGKTTLLHVAGMRLLPTRGTVEVLGARDGGTDARALRTRVAFVSQATMRSLRPTLSAHDVVLTGRYAALEPWWHDYAPDDHTRAERLLSEAGLGRVSACCRKGSANRCSWPVSSWASPSSCCWTNRRRVSTSEPANGSWFAWWRWRGPPTPRPSCWSRTTSRRSPRARPTWPCYAPGAL